MKDLLEQAADVVLFATTDEWPSAVRSNPRRKRTIDEEVLSLYDGLEGMLVKTALIRHEDWPTAKRGEPKVEGATDAVRLCRHLRLADQEQVIVLALGNAMQLKAIYEVVKGGTSSSGAELVHFIKVPILVQATRVILVHNHPGGKPAPSHDDIAFTRKLKGAYACLDIVLLDHIILAALTDDYFSFVDRGMMP